MKTLHIKTAVTAAALAGALAAGAAAQDRAPREQQSALLNGKKVTVDYGRPALNGRTLDQLLSKLGADRVWRAGENQVTTLTTESDVTIGGKKVPAGKYSLYLYLPQGGDWHLLLNTNPGIPLKEIYAAAKPEVANELWPRLDGYEKVAASEVLRVPLRRVPAAAPQEKFLISMEPAKGGKRPAARRAAPCRPRPSARCRDGRSAAAAAAASSS
jgi:hypothetical protein